MNEFLPRQDSPLVARSSTPEKGFVVIYRLIPVVLSALSIIGCGIFGGLRVAAIEHSAIPPGNVAVYLSVSDGSEPVTDLEEGDFNVFENGLRLDRANVGLTMLDRSTVATHKTLLLVDTSTAKEESTRRQLARGAASFVKAVRKQQHVTVYAFDGGADLVLIGDYPSGTDTSPDELAKLTAHTPRDASRNLHGASLAALKELDARLMSEKKSVRIGTLVVFTAGPDLAGRVPLDQLDSALSGSRHHLLTVVVAPETQSVDVGQLSRDGLLRAPSLSMAGIGLDEAARRVNSLERQYYLVQYCSPARAGTRRLTLEVKRTTLDGQEQEASVDLDFDATGFTAKCDPRATPRFVRRAAATTPDAPVTTDKPTPQPKPDDDVLPPPDAPGYAPLPKPKN